MPPEREIQEAWGKLSEFGYHPLGTGFDPADLDGKLPSAIEFALTCLVQQREDLLKEVLKFRANGP